MKVYYSGYGFIYDESLDELQELGEWATTEHLEKFSRGYYRGYFKLPAIFEDDLKIIGKAKVNFLLYEDDHDPITVREYGKIESKNARLHLSDNKGDYCPIEIQNVGGVFEDLQTGNVLRLLSEEKITTKPSYKHTSELIQLMDKAIIEFWENHDPNNPPKSDAITQWLKENSKSLSGREALIMRPLRYK